MKRFKVELVFQSSGSAETDPSLIAEITAEDESQALAAAKSQLSAEHPEQNFAKIWCWHIEALSQPRS